MQRPSRAFLRIARTALLPLGCALWLAGCGQRGPLYLPDQPPQKRSAQAAPAAPAAAPVTVPLPASAPRTTPDTVPPTEPSQDR